MLPFRRLSIYNRFNLMAIFYLLMDFRYHIAASIRRRQIQRSQLTLFISEFTFDRCSIQLCSHHLVFWGILISLPG
jgi:hypothetical protein